MLMRRCEPCSCVDSGRREAAAAGNNHRHRRVPAVGLGDDGWVSMGDGLVETTPGAREAHVRGSVGFDLSMFRDAGRGIGGQGTSRV